MGTGNQAMAVVGALAVVSDTARIAFGDARGTFANWLESKAIDNLGNFCPSHYEIKYSNKSHSKSLKSG